MISILLPHCWWCKHRQEQSAPPAREVFPNGIPKDILWASDRRWTSRPGDGGVVFAPGLDGDEWVDSNKEA
jgi:hypothetical protein